MFHGNLLNLIFLSPTRCMAMKDKGSLASNLGTVEVTLRDSPRSEQSPGTAEGELALHIVTKKSWQSVWSNRDTRQFDSTWLRKFRKACSAIEKGAARLTPDDLSITPNRGRLAMTQFGCGHRLELFLRRLHSKIDM
jgi:hypothetical protein